MCLGSFFQNASSQLCFRIFQVPPPPHLQSRPQFCVNGWITIAVISVFPIWNLFCCCLTCPSTQLCRQQITLAATVPGNHWGGAECQLLMEMASNFKRAVVAAHISSYGREQGAVCFDKMITWWEVTHAIFIENGSGFLYFQRYLYFPFNIHQTILVHHGTKYQIFNQKISRANMKCSLCPWNRFFIQRTERPIPLQTLPH